MAGVGIEPTYERLMRPCLEPFQTHPAKAPRGGIEPPDDFSRLSINSRAPLTNVDYRGKRAGILSLDERLLLHNRRGIKPLSPARPILRFLGEYKNLDGSFEEQNKCFHLG